MSQVALPKRAAAHLSDPLTLLSWGAFKIGRNERIKYPTPYDLPTEAESTAIVHGVVALGINMIDTAPAYGLSEERVGRALAALPAALRGAVMVSTKAGETFDAGNSTYDFTRGAIEGSITRSLERLQRSRLDIVSIHSDGSDLAILRDGGALAALESAKARGGVGAIGFSPKSVEGARAALADPRIDAIMVEFHPDAPEMAPVVEDAFRCGKAVLVKKPLASGRLDPASAIPWILAHKGVTTIVLGGLSLARLRANVLIAARS